ncbi:MAG: hypothetical protein AAGK17_00775 [Pseudomonadota bacterium]
MELNQTVQHMSDEFHALTDSLDSLIESLSLQLANATQVRRETCLTGVESQRTIAHLTEALSRATETRKSITLAHSSAEKDAKKTEALWDCPEARIIAPNLRAVG